MDDPAVYGRLILLALLLFCSAFFSGGEVALFSLAPIKVVSLSRKPGVGMVIGRLLENPRRLLVTLLTGNEIVNVSISAVSGYLLHKAGLQGYQAVICTAATVLVLGEITPKTIAFRRSEGYAKLVARPLLAMSYLITPVRIALEAIVVGLMKEDGQAEGEESLERTDIAIMVDEMLQSGELGEQESNTIRVILDLEERRVSEIMTPRTDIFALPVEMTVEQALAPVRGANFSRVPVVREDADHVEGVLYARDLLTAGERDTLGQIARPAIFVPEQQRVDDLIVRLRQERVHLAVVVDEFGGTAGIVTMDDALEKIFGSIPDEFGEPEETMLEEIEPGIWVVDAGMQLDDFSQTIGVETTSDEFDTVGGWAFGLFGHLPEEGERVEVDDLIVWAAAVEGTRIRKLKIESRAAPQQEPQ